MIWLCSCLEFKGRNAPSLLTDVKRQITSTAPVCQAKENTVSHLRQETLSSPTAYCLNNDNRLKRLLKLQKANTSHSSPSVALQNLQHELQSVPPSSWALPLHISCGIFGLITHQLAISFTSRHLHGTPSVAYGAQYSPLT